MKGSKKNTKNTNWKQRANFKKLKRNGEMRYSNGSEHQWWRGGGKERKGEERRGEEGERGGGGRGGDHTTRQLRLG